MTVGCGPTRFWSRAHSPPQHGPWVADPAENGRTHEGHLRLASGNASGASLAINCARDCVALLHAEAAGGMNEDGP